MQSECQLWEFCCKTLEIITHSLKNSLCTHGCAVFLLPCDQRNPLFPHHVLGHYYLITELSNSPSVRPECFASTHTSQQWRQKKKKITGVSNRRFVLHDIGCQKKKSKAQLKWLKGACNHRIHTYKYTLLHMNAVTFSATFTHTHIHRGNYDDQE